MEWPDEYLDRIIQGEHLAVLADVPGGVIDLTVTSPPYGELREYDGYKFDFAPLAAELYRVTKPGGVVMWIVGDETRDGDESGDSHKSYF